MTLNECIDDILLEARNNQIGESEKLSRLQIALWINTYRAMLIKQDIDKGRTINPLYTQYMEMDINKINENGNCVYKSDKKLPALIDFNYSMGVVSIKDMFGNLIQIGSETKMKYQKYRKFTCSHYIAYIKDDYIYVQGGPNLIEKIQVQVIAEDPTELEECYDPDTDQYPIPAAMWSTIKQLIFDRDLNVMRTSPSDTTNDSNDDNQNINTKK